MHRFAAFFAALLLGSATAAPPAQTATAWRPINADSDYAIDSTGDALTGDGARLVVRTQRDVGDKTGGALGDIDAAAFRNARVVLSALIDTDAGTRDAAIWLRVDGPAGRLALANSVTDPIAGGQAPAPRVLGLNVPPQAQRIVYGVMYTGSGALRANAIRLRAAPADVRSTATAQATAREVLDAALAIVREHALNAGAIDWNAAPAQLRASVPTNGDRADAHAAVRTLLAMLGDGHSVLLAASGRQETRPARRPPGVVVERLANGSGYVRVPAYAAAGADAAQRFAAAAIADIARIAGSVEHGWIVDLRDNAGGNMWPMLAALEPLLGSEGLGSFQDRDGNNHAWRKAGENTTPAALPMLQASRVAVLIGARTGSAGEIVAVAFRGRPDTRSFGQATAGQTSSNRVFVLPDGSRIALTTARIVDRHGNVLPTRLQPDETTPATNGGADDPTLAAAVAWLAQR